MRYLTRYAEMVKQWYLKVSVSLIFVLSVVQSSMLAVGIHMDFYAHTGIVAIVWDMGIRFSTKMPYGPL